MPGLLRRLWGRAQHLDPSATPRPERPDTIDLIGAEYDVPEVRVAKRTLIICSAPRTGSYELCRLLTAAGVGIAHEYFHPKYSQMAASRWGIEGDPLSEDIIGTYIDTLRRRRTRSGVFATKLQFWQFDRWLRNRHGVALFADASIVHLFRPDVARQFNSMRAAMMTGRWDFSDRASQPPREDNLQNALAMLDLLVAEDAGLRRLFALLGKTPIFVTTEDVVCKPRETVERIAQSMAVKVDGRALDEMIATSASYPRGTEAEKAVKLTAEALRQRAFQAS